MTKWIATFLMMVVFVLVMTNKKMEMKAIFNDYQFAKSSYGKEVHVERGKAIMRPSLMPYALEIYSTGRNIEFAEALINACNSQEGTDLLWSFVESPETPVFTRTICMAHLLNRNQYRVWSVVTEEDIDFIASSVPAHVVHWKTLLMKYSGQSLRAFKNDTYPERHKFKALFRECIRMYALEE